MNMNNTHVLTSEQISEIKAAAVMEFVNVQVGAFEACFVDTPETSLYSMYRFAQHHVKDNFGVIVPSMAERWGNDLAVLTRTD